MDRLRRLRQRAEDGRALDMVDDGEISDEARAEGYVRPRGVDAEVKLETNAVIPCDTQDPCEHGPWNGLVEYPESVGCCSQFQILLILAAAFLQKGTNEGVVQFWGGGRGRGNDFHVVGLSKSCLEKRKWSSAKGPQGTTRGHSWRDAWNPVCLSAFVRRLHTERTFCTGRR